MDFIKGFDRDQLVMLDFESCVSSDSWARIVDLFVQILPLTKLGFNDTLSTRGRPPFHCSDMLKQYLYGYKNHLRSSRKLEHVCNVNLEVIWLLKDLKPSAIKIAYFRKNNAEAFKQAFCYFVVLPKDWDLIEGEIIAIDSFKIRVLNSLKNNFNQNKIDRHIAYIDNKIKEYEEQLDQEDQELEFQKIKTKIDYQNSKKKKYRQIEKQLQESGEHQISLNDTNALSGMALNAKALLGVQSMNTITDKGYTTGKHLELCTKNQITPYSSPKDHSSQHNGLYPMIDFKYDSQKDTYLCPNKIILSTNGTIYNKANHKVKHYKNRQTSKVCTLRALCTKNKNSRFIERSIYQEALEENKKRVDFNPDYYRLRQQITEHQFGALKRQWGFTYTLIKGKAHVLSEVNLMMMCYNLKKLTAILEPNIIKNRLKNLRLYYIQLIDALLEGLSALNSFVLFKILNILVILTFKTA